LYAAQLLRAKDRRAGLVPKYSVIAYLVTYKIFDECCAACGAADDLSIDHHHPASLGAAIEPGNAVLLCRRCNSAKHDRPP